MARLLVLFVTAFVDMVGLTMAASCWSSGGYNSFANSEVETCTNIEV